MAPDLATASVLIQLRDNVAIWCLEKSLAGHFVSQRKIQKTNKLGDVA